MTAVWTLKEEDVAPSTPPEGQVERRHCGREENPGRGSQAETGRKRRGGGTVDGTQGQRGPSDFKQYE